METEYVILPEFSTGEIIKIKLSERQKKESEQYDDFEEYLATLEKEYGFRLDDCQWMITENLDIYCYQNGEEAELNLL